MRRLPVYIVIDTSGSMKGPKISAVKEGLRILISSLQKDPRALETVSVSIIQFNTEADLILPLTSVYKLNAELNEFSELAARGWTNIEKALRLLNHCISNDLVTGDFKKEIKGDHKPLVFFLSDGGQSRGSWKNYYLEWEKGFKKLGGFYVLAAFGGQYKTHLVALEKIAFNPSNVQRLNEVSAEEIINWFRWISQSITV